jgi:Flp pilus assembly pilin Flp
MDTFSCSKLESIEQKAIHRDQAINGSLSLHQILTDESGQGITEYGAILAFVALLIALVFTLTNGALSASISQAFSAVIAQLNNLSSTAAAGSS